MLCRHCHEHQANRPRGLCWLCYQDLAIRNRYPMRDRLSSRLGLGRGSKRNPCLRASALPGTEGKLVALAERCRKEQEMFHPQDAERE